MLRSIGFGSDLNTYLISSSHLKSLGPVGQTDAYTKNCKTKFQFSIFFLNFLMSSFLEFYQVCLFLVAQSELGSYCYGKDQAGNIEWESSN